MAFYEENRDFLKGNREKVFKEFSERGILNRTILETFFCLILKKERANKVKDYRPISFITS